VAADTPYLTTPPRPPSRPADLDLAREVVGPDVYARSRAQNGLDGRFVVGSLDHGEGVQDAAFARGGTAEGHADQWVEAWEDTLGALGVEPDLFIRTSETAHQRVVKALFLKLFDQDDIAKATAGGGYILRASRHEKAIAEALETRRDAILPGPLHEATLRTLGEEGLSDLPISRASDGWGIPVPIDRDQAIEDWFDALVSYLTSSGYLADPQLFERTWPPTVQIVTREDLRVHALAWPALLCAAGLQLPEHLVVRGRLTVEGAGEAADAVEQFGCDAVRYGLLRAADFTADATLTTREFVELCNADLSERLAGLVADVLAAIEHRSGGVVPRPGSLGDAEGSLVESASGLFAATSRLVGELDFRSALDRVWSVVDEAHAYAGGIGLTTAAEGRRLDTALYILAETCRLVAFSLRPFLPRAAWAIEARLGVDDEGRTAADLAAWGLTRPQARVQSGEPLLPPIALPTS